MTALPRSIGVQVRPYRDADEGAVLQLLGASLGAGPGGARSAAFFHWKHVENPFGRSSMLVAEADGRVVGLRAFMRWSFVAGGVRVRAVRAVDTATHPDFQGRGIFAALTREAIAGLRSQVDLVFNTPNDKSGPGYLKMGWAVVGKVPILVRVRRPLRFARHARSWRIVPQTLEGVSSHAPQAAAVLAAADLERFLEEVETPAGISTRRDAAYLRWRYGEAPLLDYRAVEERTGGQLRGLAIFRVRPRGRLQETTLSDVLVRSGDRYAARALLRAVGRSARTDHIASALPPGSSALAAARRNGFLRTPDGMTLMANTLGHHLDPDPLRFGSWGLSLGDLEVF